MLLPLSPALTKQKRQKSLPQWVNPELSMLLIKPNLRIEQKKGRFIRKSLISVLR